MGKPPDCIRPFSLQQWGFQHLYFIVKTGVGRTRRQEQGSRGGKDGKKQKDEIAPMVKGPLNVDAFCRIDRPRDRVRGTPGAREDSG